MRSFRSVLRCFLQCEVAPLEIFFIILSQNEARFRVEAEQMAKAVSDQLFVLRESLKASEEQKARLEAELKASHQRFTVALSASESAFQMISYQISSFG